MDLGIAGKYALVTGGSHGIGLATAQALAAEGCHVAICSRDRQRLDSAVETIRSAGVNVLTLVADVLNPEDILRTVDSIIQTWGTLHILVNNVGGGGRWGKPSVEDTPEQVWLEVFGKNAMAAVRFTRRILPFMRKQKWGRVVTVASILGKEGGGRPWHNMAKSAEISLMKTLAMNHELAGDGVTFNTVAPGAIAIPGTGWETEQKRDPEAFRAMLERDFPLGRLGAPEEVAACVAFLCSERAALVNGACVVVDGGQSRAF